MRDVFHRLLLVLGRAVIREEVAAECSISEQSVWFRRKGRFF
jgi:hypothetical protein